MDRYRILRNIVTGGMVIFMTCLVLFGCGEQPPPEPPPKAKEVRKKISARPGPLKTEPLAAADLAAADKSSEAKAPAPESGKAPAQETGKPMPDSVKPETAMVKSLDDAKSGPGAVDAKNPKPGEAVQTASAKTDAKSGSGESEKSSASPSDAPAEVPAEDDEAMAAISAMDAEDASKFTASYNPRGKADPFEPLLREQPKKQESRQPEPLEAPGEPSKPKPPIRRLTPLEKLDLGQLKLVGIIRSSGGNRALVEEASGKGYIIVKGTPIGIHSGVVVDILPDRVLVEEQDEDALGKVTVIKRILKFNRPEEEGEELL